MFQSLDWWRTTFATIVAIALVVWLVTVFPYGYTVSAAGKGALITMKWLWSIFTTLLYYYAWSFRYINIALSANGYDWSAGYCTPNGAFSAIGFFGWKIEEMYAFSRHVYMNEIDRSSPDFAVYCISSGWNAFGTMFFGHFLVFGFVVVGICFGELTRVVLETEYISLVSNVRLSARLREVIGTYAFLATYPLCGIAHYLIRHKFGESAYSYTTSLIITAIVLALTMRCTLFLYRWKMWSISSSFESYMSSTPSYLSSPPPTSPASPPSPQLGVEGRVDREDVEDRENERLLSVV